MLSSIRKVFTLHPGIFLTIVLIASIAFANLTSHTEALLDTLLLVLDSDADGAINDESWYTGLESATSNNIDPDRLAGDTDDDNLVEGDIVEDASETEAGVITPGAQTIGGVKTFASTPVIPVAAPTADAQVANKKYVDDNVVAGGITSVLGDNSGAVPLLFQTWSAFTGADTTPDVRTATLWRTVDTTTITDFDGTPVDGQFIYVYCAAATVFDFTSSGLESWNRTTDLTATVGQILAFKYRSTQWYCQNCPDEFETLSSDGLVVNSSGSPLARSLAGAGLAAATNADGTAGNPTITVTAEDASGINTGTATDEAVTADALAGSVVGTRTYTLKLFAVGDTVTTGDGKNCFSIPEEATGMNLVSVGAHVFTNSSSGTPTFQIRNATDTQDMLSTALTIDANEPDSATAATAAVINTAYDDVVTGDSICGDVDVAGTGAAGAELRFGFRLP